MGKQSIYKVYSRASILETSNEPFEKISKKQAEELICDAIEDMACKGVLRTEEEIETLFDNAKYFFQKYGFFRCGDFKVEITDGIPEPQNDFFYDNDFMMLL